VRKHNTEEITVVILKIREAVFKNDLNNILVSGFIERYKGVHIMFKQDSIIPGLYVVEGAQISSGSVIKWFKDQFIRRSLEEEAEKMDFP
jgi:hypothetical protein